jgi:hypothetical protein
MLLSKSNLAVAAVASTNPYDGALNGVLIAEDGSTVASNGRVVLAVGPAREGVGFPDVGPLASVGSGVVLRPEFVEEAEGIIPKDKRVSLQHVAITEARDPGKVELCTIDKSGRERRVADRPKRERYPDWQGVIRKAGGSLRVAVARGDLLSLLRAMERAAPDDGTSPLFLEVGQRGVVLRAASKETGQRVIGVAQGLRVEGWLAQDAWERGIMGAGQKLSPVRK